MEVDGVLKCVAALERQPNHILRNVLVAEFCIKGPNILKERADELAPARTSVGWHIPGVFHHMPKLPDCVCTESRRSSAHSAFDVGRADDIFECFAPPMGECNI